MNFLEFLLDELRIIIQISGETVFNLPNLWYWKTIRQCNMKNYIGTMFVLKAKLTWFILRKWLVSICILFYIYIYFWLNCTDYVSNLVTLCLSFVQDDGKRLVGQFLEYLVKNYRVIREPETRLQAFLLSVVCTGSFGLCFFWWENFPSDYCLD